MNNKIVPKVVFIMGSGHCGSTLLDLILGSHTQSFSLGELQRIHNSIDSSSNNTQICGVCENRCPFWDNKVQLPLLKLFYSKANKGYAHASKIAQCIYNPYKLLRRWSDKNMLIDSSKNPRWIQRQLRFSYRWIGITPYLIYMIRDGRAVVSAYRRKYHDKGIKDITKDWKRKAISMNRFYEQFPTERRTTVSYEELATQPELVVKSLCQFLNIDYEPEMLRYWTHEHHHLYGNGGTRALIYRFREQLQQSSPELRKRAEHAKQFYAHEYYDQIEIAIKLDDRWRGEMTKDDLDIFDAIGGEINRSLINN